MSGSKTTTPKNKLFESFERHSNIENTLALHLALLSTFYTKWKLSWKIYEIRQKIRLYKCTLFFIFIPYPNWRNKNQRITDNWIVSTFWILNNNHTYVIYVYFQKISSPKIYDWITDTKSFFKHHNSILYESFSTTTSKTITTNHSRVRKDWKWSKSSDINVKYILLYRLSC